MKDEVLKKLNNTDSAVIPHYDIILPTGEVFASRVQIVLKNTVLEPGTPLNKQNLLNDDTSTLLGLDPETSTPDMAFATIINYLKGICPKIAVKYTIGGTVYLRNMTTNETVQQVVGSDGYAKFDIFEFNGYEYWGSYNDVTTEHDWTMIDTAKLYEVSLV